MAGNSILSNAKSEKKDEFYTQLADIEKEMKHYKSHFKGKIVFCNCDDPYESNFFKYFALNFNFLQLKKLIATCYATSPIAYTQLSLFDSVTDENNTPQKKPYKIEITEVNDENHDGRTDLADVEYLLKNKNNVLSLLREDGDFRSSECIELLKEADIVTTNPPFSLWRQVIMTLVKYDKEFVILGNVNAITYKDFFPLIMNNKVWLGASIHSGDREFRVPDDYPLNASGYRVDESGIKYIRVKGVRWYTNIDYEERHEDLILYKHYTPAEYPKYDNYDAIEVSKTSDIPCDYDGVMGVPITFLDKYNPEQFEIIGTISAPSDPNTLNLGVDYSKYIGYTQDKKRNGRTGATFGKCPVIVTDDKKHPYYEKDGIRVQTTYHRVFILNKHPEKPKRKEATL